MPASARTARTLLNVETLEGRVVPAVVRPPILANTGLVTHLPGATLASAPTVSRVFVNGELELRVQGKVRFSSIGPALSCDESGHSVETGGTKLFGNGQHLGTFEHIRYVTKTVEFRVNRLGHVVRLVTFHVRATPYVEPPASEAAWAHVVGGPRVG